MRLHHQNGAILASAFLGLALFSARASAVPESVVAAVNANNVTALEVLSKSAPTAQQRTLAVGALLALRHEDAEAIATLTPLTRSTASRAVRATAYLALSDVYSRDQRYRACYSAIRAASQLSPQSVNLGYRQAMAFAQALAEVKPMQLVRERSGSLPITEEKVGMIRVPVEIDGHRRGALVDTGANFSTISASAAKRSGIEVLSRPASVGSSTEQAVAVQLGIAKRLQIGNAMLKNVVFIVVPDAGWGIPRKFGISAIVGVPVLMALGRLEFVNSDPPPSFTMCHAATVPPKPEPTRTYCSPALSPWFSYVFREQAGHCAWSWIPARIIPISLIMRLRMRRCFLRIPNDISGIFRV